MNNLYTEIILDLNKNPKNFGKIDHNLKFEGENPLCGDSVTIYVKTRSNIENTYIENISFEGVGCAISIASVSLMTEALKGKTLKEAKDIISQFFNMINRRDFEKSSIGKLIVFSNISQYPARVKCATMCFHTLNNNLID